MRRGISVLAKKDGDLRTETFLGEEYLVVPVVALVEGVLQGMNAAEPELALAEEFGRTPAGWDGRPLVMNHPVVNGSPVSANSPEILESYAFGQIFNTVLDDKKLKCEAWICKSRVEELGGDAKTTLDRIQDGEIIEISTGLFTDLEEKKGRFNGEDYAGVWRNIVPDHLAFLSEGAKGACSVEDGCGTPRTNASASASQLTVFNSEQGQYGASGSIGDPGTPVSPAWRFMSAKPADCGCGCGGKCKDNHQHEEPAVSKAVILVNSVPSDMTYSDVSSLLNTALQSVMGSDYYYLATFSQDKVVYYSYLYEDGRSKSGYFQRSYSIDAGGQVTLGSDAERVNLLTEIVPAKDPKVNQTQESVMPDDKTKQTTPASPSADPKANNDGSAPDPKTTSEAAGSDQEADPKATPKDNSASEPKAPAASVTQAQTPTQPSVPKFNSVQEYLDAAPEGMRDVLESGLRLHNDKKAGLIKGLMDTGRCKFSEESLKAMSMQELENMAELANVPATFEGRATPKMADNSADNEIPLPQKLQFNMEDVGARKH